MTTLQKFNNPIGLSRVGKDARLLAYPHPITGAAMLLDEVYWTQAEGLAAADDVLAELATAPHRDEAKRQLRAQLAGIVRREGPETQLHGSLGVIRGLACPIDQWSRLREHPEHGPYWKLYRQGSFRQVLAERQPIVCQANHDETTAFAGTEQQTLAIWESPLGIQFEATIPNTPNGRRVFEAGQAGMITGVSIHAEGDAVWDKSGDELFHIWRHVDALTEISIMISPERPRFPQTSERVQFVPGGKHRVTSATAWGRFGVC